jgi:hypothetical protein
VDIVSSVSLASMTMAEGSSESVNIMHVGGLNHKITG